MEEGAATAPLSAGRVGERLQSPAAQRMRIVAASASIVSFYFAATDIMLPLWATSSLGMSNSQWGQLRSLRMAAVAVGVIVLGAIADHLGTRRVAMASFMTLSCISLALLPGGSSGVWFLVPAMGVLLSSSSTNLNTLTQDVTASRPGVANTIYRGISAAAAIPAPIIVTFLAARYQTYAPVLYLLAALMVLSAFILGAYPSESAKKIGPLREEFVSLMRTYSIALRERRLLHFLLLSQIWCGLVAGALAFSAIRFTRELGMPEPAFGLLWGVIGALMLFGIMALGVLLDRVSLRVLHGWLALVAGTGVFLMGLGNSIVLSSVGLFLTAPVVQMSMAPNSLWVGRAVNKENQVAAFSLYKTTAALCSAGCMVLLSWLEAKVGLRMMFLCEGLAAIVLGGLLFLLREPARTK